MGDVVSPRFRDRRMWVCNCGCATFTLMADGTAECAACNALAEDGGGWSADATDAGEWQGEAPVREIFSGGYSPDFSRRRVAGMASDDDVAMIVVAKESGTVSAWGKDDTGGRVAWLGEKLDAARKLFERQ